MRLVPMGRLVLHVHLDAVMAEVERVVRTVAQQLAEQEAHQAEVEVEAEALTPLTKGQAVTEPEAR